MKDVKIVRGKDTKPQLLPGALEKKAGWIKRLIYPDNVGAERIVIGVAEANPGYSIHPWHTHTRYKSKGIELVYPENFEEIYYIIRGSGVVQWKTQSGRIREKKVIAGDSIFFPVGVSEHQLLNKSRKKILVLYCGSPIPKVTLTESDAPL